MSTPDSITGRCQCGAVQLEVRGKLGPAGFCHCSQCRRANGSAFASNAPVRSKYLRITALPGAITEYESSPGKFRAFCARCGSPMYSRTLDDPDIYRLRLGTLDGDPGRRPSGHVWVGSKAPWFTISDDLPQFSEGLPPDAGARR